MRSKATVAAALALGLGLSACGGPADSSTPAGDTASQGGSAVGSAAGGPSKLAAAPGAFGQCRSCHAVEPGKRGIGPSLAGVFGARAGHQEGYAYSKAMLASGLVWDEATLDRFLLAPQGLVPGTKMMFAGVRDEARRAELIAYLKTL